MQLKPDFLFSLYYGHNVADSGNDGVKRGKLAKSEIQSAASFPIVSSRGPNRGFYPIAEVPLAPRLYVKISRSPPTILAVFMNRRYNLRCMRRPAVIADFIADRSYDSNFVTSTSGAMPVYDPSYDASH